MESRDQLLQRVQRNVEAAQARVQAKTAELKQAGYIQDINLNTSKPKPIVSTEVAQQLLNPLPVQYENTSNPVVDTTIGGQYSDLIPMTGSGLGRFASLVGTGMAAVNTAGEYTINKLSGGDITVDEALQKFANRTNLLGDPGRQITKASQEQYSIPTQQSLAELSAIQNNRNLTETQGALETAKWAARNPSTVALLTGENVLGSGLGTSAVGAVLSKAMSLGARVGVSTGIQEAAGYLDDRANKTGTLTTDDVKVSVGVGIVNGLLERYIGGTGKNFDMESNILGLQNMSRQHLKELPLAMGREAATEIPQEITSQVAGNMQDGNSLEQGIGSAGTLGGILGSTTTGLYAIPHVVKEASVLSDQASNASKSLANKAIEASKQAYKDKTDPYIFDVHSDPTNPKYDPARAYSESMRGVMSATDQDSADLAAKQGQQVFVKATKYIKSLMDNVKAATTDEEKIKAQEALDHFADNYYIPLKQTKALLDNTGQVKPSNSNATKATGADYVTQKVAESIKVDEAIKPKVQPNTISSDTSILPTTSQTRNIPTNINAGGLVRDVIIGGKSEITSPYGDRSAPVAGASTNHNGVDLKAAVNTPIKAPMSGTIVGVNTNEHGGKQLFLRLDNGYTLGFAHLNQQNFKQGDKVNAGDVIALSGNTGKGTGAHIHFTVRDPQGKHIDPTNFSLSGNSQSTQTNQNSNTDIKSATVKQLPNGNWVTDNPVLDRFIAVESFGKANASNGQHQGLFQLSSNLRTKYGVTNPHDPQQNLEGAKQYLEENANGLKSAGIPVNTTTLYLAHQQGQGGIQAIYKAAQQGQDIPYRPELRKSGGDIRYNMDNNGGKGKSPKEFLDYWATSIETKYANFSKANGIQNLTDTGYAENSTPPETTSTSNNALEKARNVLAQAISQRESIEKIQELSKQVEELKAQSKSNNETVEPTPEQKEQSRVTVAEAAQQIRANTLDATHIDQLEQTGVLTEADANELRRMLDIQRVVSAQKSAIEVNNNVYDGSKGKTVRESDIGLNEYQTVLDDAIDNNDTATLKDYMGKLSNFTHNQTSKAAALEEALSMNPSASKPLYIAPDKDNNWNVFEGTTSRSKDDPTFQAGAFQVYAGNSKTNDMIIQNATDVASVHDAYQSIISNRQSNGLVDSFDVKTTSSRAPKSKFNEPSNIQATSKKFSTWKTKDFIDNGITLTSNDENQQADDSIYTMIQMSVNKGINSGMKTNTIINQASKVANALGFTLDDKSLSNLTNQIESNKGNITVASTNPTTTATTPVKPKEFNNTTGNVRTVSYNEAGDIEGKLAKDEVWVGHDFTKDSAGKTVLNKQDGLYKKGLSGFTYNNTDLQGNPDSRSLAIEMFGEHGMFGNPYRTNATNSFKAKDHQDALNKYIGMFKSYAGSTHGSRMQFFENLEQLRGKKLVTDQYSSEEAKFLDHILNAPEAKPLWDAMVHSNNEMPVKEREALLKPLQDWITGVDPEFSAPNNKGKVTITGFTQGNSNNNNQSNFNIQEANKPIDVKNLNPSQQKIIDAVFNAKDVLTRVGDTRHALNAVASLAMNELIGENNEGVNSPKHIELTKAIRQIYDEVKQGNIVKTNNEQHPKIKQSLDQGYSEVSTAGEVVNLKQESINDSGTTLSEVSINKATGETVSESTSTKPVNSSSTITPKGKTKSKTKAPSKMLSQTELKTGITLDSDETIDDLLQHVAEEMDLTKPNDLAKVLGKLVVDGLVNINDNNQTEYEYLRSLTLTMANFMGKPKLVINSKATEATYNPESNTITAPVTDNLFGDIAAIVLKQATLDIADDVDNYADGLLESVSFDNTEYPDVMTDSGIANIQEIRVIHDKLVKAQKALNRDLLTKNLDNLKLDSETRKAIYVLANNSLGDFLSVGLSNKNVREFLKTVTYRDNKKSKGSLYNYIVKSFREFFGFTDKEANVLDTLLSITSDIAQIKLNESDFATSIDARQSVMTATDKQIIQELKKPYKTRNRFMVSFKQGKDKPLASIKDLMTKVSQDPIKAAQYLLHEQLTPEQEREVQYFADFANKFTIYLKSAFDKNVMMNKDLKAYLYDSDTGNLDTNLAGALSLAVYDYVKPNGSKNKNTYDDVKGILNVDKDSDVIIPGYIYRQYSYMGKLASFTAADLGKTVVQALDISETEHAKYESLSELEMSLGNWAMYAMQVAELGSLQFISQEQHLNNITEVGGTVPEGLSEHGSDYIFFTFKASEDAAKSTRVEEILKVGKGTQGIIARLFNVDSGIRYPKLKQPTSVKRKIKKSNSLVSNLQATFMEAMQKESIEVDTNTYDAMTNLLNQDTNWFKGLIGAYVSKSELNKMHINDRESAEAAAEGLNRELENGLGFIGSLKRTKQGFQQFWDSVYAARNNRMHYNSNVFNMQTSLIHRMLASYKNFKTTINMTDVTVDNLLDHALDAKGNPTKLGLFLSAVAMNMEDFDSQLSADIKQEVGTELKAYTKDKVYSKHFMPAFVKLLQTGEVQFAIKAMQKAIKGAKLSNNELTAIEGFVNIGGMGIQSVRALVELANLYSAIQNGTELTTAIGVGSDGINNGIALASIYNGTADDRTLMQTGFIPKNTRGINNQFDTKLHKDTGDYYEAFAEVLSRHMSDAKENSKSINAKKLIQTIEEIQPAFDIKNNAKAARKFAKAIIIPFGYSAGIGRLLQVAQETFISDIQKKMAKLANDTSMTNTSQEYVALQEQLQTLLGDKQFKLPNNPKDLLEFWFTPKQLGTLSKNYNDTVGGALATALDEFAGTFQEVRNRNITMHEATFKLFNELRNTVINTATKEMANELGITDKEMQDRGFTNAQWNTLVEPKLKQITPKIFNAFETTQGDIQTSETVDPIEDGLSSLEVLTRGKKFVSGKVVSKVKGKNDKDELLGLENNLPTVERIIKSVGVFINSAQIQGTDARISAEASAMLGGKINLNIHDQNDGGIANYLNMVLTQNKATFETLATNHIQLNSLESLVSAIDSFIQLSKKLGVSDESINNILESVFEKAVEKTESDSYIDYLSTLINEVEATEQTKISILTNLQAVQQYAGETGEYVVTDKDIQLASKELDKINKRISKLENTFKESISQLDTASLNQESNNQESGSVGEVAKTTSNQEVKIDNSINIKSNFSQLTHTLPKNMLGKTFDIKQQVDNIKIISSNILDKPTEIYTNGLRNVLLALLSNTKHKTELRLITDSKEINRLKHPMNGGEFIADSFDKFNGDNLIRINVHNSLNNADIKTILTHELVHTVTATAILDTVKINPELQNRLKAVYTALSNWLNTNKESLDEHSTDSILYALTTVRELIAVSISQPEVIKHLVNIPFNEGNLYQEIVDTSIALIKQKYGKDFNSNMEKEIYVLSSKYESEQKASGRNNSTISTTNTTTDNTVKTTSGETSVIGNEPSAGQNVRKEQRTSLVDSNPIQWVKDTINDLYSRLETKNVISKRAEESARYLVDTLLTSNPDVKIEIKSKDFLDTQHKDAKGLYDVNTNTIYILNSTLDAQGDNAYDSIINLLHEVVHANTERNINSGDKQYVKSIEALEELRQKLLAVGSTNPVIQTALSSISELAAYGMTHETVKAFIAEHGRNTRAVSKTEAVRSFLGKLASLLGLTSNKYKQFVIHVDNLSQFNPDPNPTPPKGGKPLANTQSASHITGLSMGSMSSQHDSHLNNVLSMLSTFTANDPNRNRAVQQSSQTKTPKSITTGLGLSDKEQSTYESVKAMLSTYIQLQGNSVAVRELHNIVRELNAGQLTKEDFVDDWSTASKDEKKIATTIYNTILGNNPSNMKSDVLIKFTALALTSEKFRQILDKPRQRLSNYGDKSYFDKLMGITEDVINTLTDKYTKTSNKNITGQIDRLFYNLHVIDEKARINKETLDQKVWDSIGVAGNVVNKLALSALAKAINKVKGSSNECIQDVASLSNEFAKNDAAKVATLWLDTISKFGPLAGKRYGEGRNLANDIVSNTPIKKMHEEFVRFAKTLGQKRQMIQENTREVLLSEFTNNGKELTREQRESITAVALRSDVASLLDYMGITEVIGLLRNHKNREARIKELEQQIESLQDGNDMIMQAKALAMYMVTNRGSKHLVKSTQLITIRHGLPNEVSLDKMDQSIYEAVNTLTSLYAVRYGYSKAGYHFDQVMTTEEQGIKALLKTHKDLIDRSKNDFKSNPYNYSKGYLPNITDPHRSLVWVEPQEVGKYLSQGWETIMDKPLDHDSLDNTFDRVLLYHPHMDYQDRVSGGLDLIDTHAKGQIVYAEDQDLIRIAKARAQERIARSKFMNHKDYNPFEEDTAMIATYGADGSIQDYHYEMESFLRDAYLQRNNDPFALLSRMDAKTQFKPVIEESQRNIAKALHEDYLKNYAKNPELFVILDPNSTDKKVRDDYALTPYAFKVEAHDLFGDSPIVVRASVYNTVFGYKTYSLGNIFNREIKNMNPFEKLFYMIFSKLLGERAKSRIIAVEDIVKELTKHAKDFIVIRNPSVLIGNIMANTMLLMLRGVNPVDIMKGYNYAWQEGQRYRRAQKVVLQLEAKLRFASEKDKPAIRQKIMEQEHYMKRSSMDIYMKSGIMSTIVEDVTVLKDELAYKTGIEKKIDWVNDKLPPVVKTPLDWLMVNPNTPLHKILSDATQFSDFSAKYVLAEHLRKQGTSHRDALSEAQESFINFDLPQGQGLDYMGKVGLFMFTKFFLRFQKVLSKLLWEKPAQTIAQHYIAESLFNVQGILDPLMTNNVGNPLDFGALNILDGEDTVVTELGKLLF